MSWNKENVNLSLELASVYYHCQTPLTLSVKFLPVFGHLTLLKYSNNSLLLFFVFVHYYLHLNLVDGCCVIVIGIIGWCCGGCRCCCCRWQWLGNATAVILASMHLSWLLISAHCNIWDDAVDKLQRRSIFWLRLMTRSPKLMDWFGRECQVSESLSNHNRGQGDERWRCRGNGNGVTNTTITRSSGIVRRLLLRRSILVR